MDKHKDDSDGFTYIFDGQTIDGWHMAGPDKFVLVESDKSLQSEATIDETEFWKIVDSQIHLAREKEKEVGGALEIPYSTKMSKLPFLFFEPPESERYFKGYRCDGSELGSDLRLFGVANERKDGINFIRDLDSNERNVSRTP